MEKYQNYFTITTLTLCLFIFLRTCGTSSELSRIEKDIESLNKKVHQLQSQSKNRQK